VVFNTGPYTVLPDNSILITANIQSETGFPSSHQLKSYVASKSRLKLAARAVLSADAGLLVNFGTPIIFLKRVKLSTSNLVFRMTVASTIECMIDYPRKWCLGSRDLFKFWQISDNISKAVQDRDTVTMDD